jgi:hypothetical protein
MSEDIEQIDSQSQDIQPNTVDSSPDSGSPPPQHQPQPQQQQSSPWEAFKRLPEFHGQDDRAIASRLYQAMEREKAASQSLAQYQQIIPYAQEYLPYRREFQEWLKNKNNPQSQQVQQAQQLQQQPEAAKAWWSPPQVRDSYKRFLVKDEDGREIIDPNAPPSAREELYEYQSYKADFARKFLEDPQAALGPMVQDLAAKQAQEIVQQQFQKVENETFVQSIEDQNKDWLFDPETGNVTPEGLLVHKYVEEARERGIKGPQARWDYAIAMTERELLAQTFDEQRASQNQLQQSVQQLMQQARTAPQPAPVPAAPQPQKQAAPDLAQQNLQYLRREAARNPSRSAGTATNDTRAPKPKMTFEQMLKEQASSQGLM